MASPLALKNWRAGCRIHDQHVFTVYFLFVRRIHRQLSTNLTVLILKDEVLRFDRTSVDYRRVDLIRRPGCDQYQGGA
jgi:hypothetical protein